MKDIQQNILVQDVAEKAKLTKTLLKENYLADNRIWVVAYSGGKDSTLLLQLVYEMIIDMAEKDRKPFYVVSNDTLVEAPPIERHLHSTLLAIESDAKYRKLSVTCKMVKPEVHETFWAKLIGKGYPPPTRTFRWCTSSIKIRPARRYIEKLTNENGSAVLLLGTRLSESSARRQRMNGREVNARGLNPHHEIPNTYVMTPIADWEVEEVWEYLLEGSKPPWGKDHRRLAELYRDATGGECPFILDMTTPSCGGSRFGCWTCTVVRQDRSLQGFIDSGDTSMIPLIQYCQWLREIREDEERRLKHRRNGTPGLGPFDARTRKELLHYLLETEKVLGKKLISHEVIEYIQSVWSSEIDLKYSAFEIARSFGRNFINKSWIMSLKKEQRRLLRTSAEQENIPIQLLEKIYELSEKFPDLTVWGTKSQMRQSIKEVINAAAGDND